MFIVKNQVETLIQDLCRKLYDIDLPVGLVRPGAKFGDYTAYVAFDLSGPLHKSPKDIATEITKELKSDKISKSEVVGPGFINIYLSDNALTQAYEHSIKWSKNNLDQQELVEFGDPNPFKEMHLGHLYTSIVGDTVARLLEASGADVKRLSYHGDVGLQVAKWVWAVGETIKWDLSKLDKTVSAKPLGFYYAKGAKAFDSDKKTKASIVEINEHIYKKDREDINRIYDLGKYTSFKQFDKVFKRIGVHFDKRYLESKSGVVGLKLVNKNTPKVFKKSNGAVVFKGEKAGLHTRVFVNSRGLPTYETKELGLTELKNEDYPKAAMSIVITGNEQAEYFKVVLAALSEINPTMAKKTRHLSHGFLSLTTGKMSSRTGDIYGADNLLNEVMEAVETQYPDTEVQNDIFIAAIRYTFLRQKIGNNIVFDTKESVSLEGNSGPYIQYAHARGQSILSKSNPIDNKLKSSLKVNKIPLDNNERYLAMKISEFPEVVEQSINDFMPHHICSYLYELAQEFNRFYEHNRVIDDPRMLTRLSLVQAYVKVLESGLDLLSIPAPVHM